MAANDLKRFLDAKKKDHRLLGDVERHLMLRPPEPRSTTVLHPSEIIKPDWCHKYATYLLKGGDPKKSRAPLRLQAAFDEGHLIHAKWQKWFGEMGVLYGDFKCLVCNKITVGTSPKRCKFCKSPLVVYDEVKLFDKSLRISGHTDGWIKDDRPDVLIEIKSIGPGTFRFEAPELLYDVDGDAGKAWNNIRRPFRSHLLQGQMYLELASRMHGAKAPREIVFLYEFKADQQHKEFVVKADREIIDRVLFSAAKVVKYAKSDGLPPCNIDLELGCKSCQLLEEHDAEVGA